MLGVPCLLSLNPMSTAAFMHNDIESLTPLTHPLLVRVWHTVGGDQERVEIHLIAHPDDDQTEARRLLTEQFASFDAGKARCFLAGDRERLLAVIEAGFGDFYDFNRVARNLLVSRLDNELSLHWSITSFVTSFVTSKVFVMHYELRNELRNEGRTLVMLYEALVTRLAWYYKASSL